VTLIYWNVYGWTRTNEFVRKGVILNFGADIVCLGETHLKGTDEIYVDGYKFVGNNRKLTHVNAIRGSGGVAFLIREIFLTNYNYTVVDKNRNDILAIKFVEKHGSFSFLIINGYLPPENSVWGRDATGFMSHILNIVYSNSDCNMVFFVGDVNARLGELSDYIDGVDHLPCRKILDFCKNSHGDAFIDLLLESKLCVLNGRLTADLDNYTSVSPKGSSVVDYIAVNHEAFDKCKQFQVHLAREAMTNANVLHNKVPDHSILELVFNAECFLAHGQTVDTNTDQVVNDNNLPRYRVKAEKVADLFNTDSSRLALIDCIENIEGFRANQEYVDQMYERFCNTYYSEMERIFGKYTCAGKYKKKLNRFAKPFWNQDLTNLWRKAREAENNFLKLPQGSRLRSILRSQYYEAQKIFDSVYSKAKRKYQREKLIEIENINVKNPHEFWKAIKKLGPKKKSDIPIETYDDLGNVITEQEQVLHTWSKQFHELYKGYNKNDFDENFYETLLNETAEMEASSEVYDENENNEWFNRSIDYEEVKKVVDRAKLAKASGIDCLPNEIFKQSDSVHLLWVLFCKIFSNDLIPSAWRLSLIKPIPKNSHIDPRCPLQYRGIALLSNVYKLYSNVLNYRIVSHIEANVLHEEQNGFRAHRSCVDHLFTLTSIIRARQSQGESTFVAYLDAEKAFDRIDHNILFNKMLKAGIKGKVYKSIKTIYGNSKCSVKVNDLLTEWFETTSGVRQGDTLSPTLFSIFVNDLIMEINSAKTGIDIGDKHVSILVYADDIALISKSENDLQKALDTVYRWSTQNMIKFNKSKSNVVHYRKKGQGKTQFTFRLGDATLSLESYYKYLGLYLDEYLNYNVTAKFLGSAGNRALGAVINKFKVFNGLGYQTFTKLFEIGVCPILEYGAEIWGFKKCKEIDMIQNKAARIYLGVHRFAPLPALYGDLGWTSCENRRKLEMFRYWNRLVQMENTRLPRVVFDWMRERAGNSWIQEIKELFKDINMIDIFNNLGEVNLTDIAEKLQGNAQDVWLENIRSMPKLRTYKVFKNVYESEPYVISFMNREKRSYLAQLRSGILPLQVEVGRWQGVPVDERKCTVCRLGFVEDECHFLFECNEYHEERKDLYANVNDNFENIPNSEKLKILMSKEYVKLFSNFLYTIYKKRQKILFN
jgi:hypothetical protein